jgi:hypothetical protein
MRRITRIALLFSYVLLVTTLIAQTGSIDGDVTDPTGAIMPGVKIVVTNIDTGLRRETQTNGEGYYTVPTLPLGRYRVSATKSGFGNAEQTGITLNVQQVARIDFSMQPGGVVEQIQVSATAVTLDSETSTVGQVIDNKRIVELPLNGRNYLNLAQLTSGTAPAIGDRTQAEGGFVAAGQHMYQLNILLDGLDNTSVASGGPLGFEAQAVKPSIDAVQEFRVVTNNISAEYGGRMGGEVIVSLKSGTNKLHGSAYEFLRNSDLDGTNFFANLNGSTKPPFRQNQFGGTLGGPIRKDKTFLFGSYDGIRIRLGDSDISTVPTVAARGGDFSGIRPIYDPATTQGSGSTMTRQPFPGNIVPVARWDPLFTKIESLYPLPTRAGLANNYFYAPTETNANDAFDFKGDHYLSDTSRLSIRFSRRYKTQFQPGPLPLPSDGGLGTITDVTSNSLVATHTKTFGSGMNNEFRFGWSAMKTKFDIPFSTSLFGDYGITGIPKTNNPGSNDHGLTRFSAQGYVDIGPRSFWPNYNDLDLYQFNDTFAKFIGGHAIKVGFQFQDVNVFRNAARFARGQFQFNREFTSDPQNRGNTGDALAEFMLGWAAGGTLGNENGENMFVKYISAFVQDDWKVTSRLTLNLGLRYDIFTAPTFPDGGVSNFILDYTNVGGNAQLQQVRPKGGSDCGCQNAHKNFGPRVGLAYRLNNKTVLRSGFGIIYGVPDYLGDDTSRFKNQVPDFVEYSFSTVDRINPRLILKNGFPSIQLPASSVPGPQSVAINSQQNYMRNQYSEQWFFDLQRELPFDVLMTLGYSGNGSHELYTSRNYNLPFGPSPLPIASREIWPYYTSVTRWFPIGNLSYNAFSFKLEKRFSRGLTFLSAFTWSHSIDTVPPNPDLNQYQLTPQQPVNPYNFELNRGNSQTDVPRTYVISATYELPFGKGKPWLHDSRFLDFLIGGWQAGGVLTLRDGYPFTVSTTGNITNAGGTDRPNALRNATLPSGTQSIYQWFDVSAFAVQPQYTFGNAGRNTLFGPSLRNIDFSLAKAFSIAEGKKLQFRFESFNFTNTPAFGQPASVINQAGAGTITSAGAPRNIQFALKFLF